MTWQDQHSAAVLYYRLDNQSACAARSKNTCQDSVPCLKGAGRLRRAAVARKAAVHVGVAISTSVCHMLTEN